MEALRILVTRPQPGADETAGRLRAAGFEPVVLPLTRIEPLRPGGPPPSSDFDAVLVTSANALSHAEPAMLAACAGKPCYAVGEHTGAATLAAGLKMAAEPMGTADALAELIIGREKPAARLLYLCGRVRRPDLTRGLRHAGFRVDEIETYDTVPASLAPGDVAGRLSWNLLWGALVYSLAGACQVDRLAAHRELKPFFEGALFFCLSERIAAGLASVEPARRRVAAEPDEGAMMTLLRQER